jgi:hypothetical protein
VLRQEAKKRAIWFYGAPNCGKTLITDFLAQIFVTQNLELAEGKFTLDSSEQHVATQLMLLDEANFHDLFKPSNIPNVKLFFEGRGYNRRVMHETPHKAYIGSCVFLTSNGLPAISKPSDDPSDSGYDWAAVRTRTTFFRMDVTHPGTAKFPFDATVLAHAIMETATLHEPSLTQCSQPQSQQGHEEEKHGPRHLRNVPDFTSDDPVLSDLLSEVIPKPNPTQSQKPDGIVSVLGKRPADKPLKQIHGQQTLVVGDKIVMQRPKGKPASSQFPSV